MNQSRPAMPVTRRALIGGAAATVALSVLRTPVALAATTDELDAALAGILQGREAIEGGIEVDAPRLAENGAQVPLTVRVDSPMTEADHVTAIHILAPLNPAPGIGTFRLTPRIARAEVFTRIRVAEAQDILFVAELSDGRVLQVAARIAVSIGGCAT
jgi:sulfur-oxidizing protein SoxY